MSLDEVCGTGHVIKDGNDLRYLGSIPFKEGEKVVLLKLEDLELMLTNSTRGLLMQNKPIGPVFAQMFPAEIIYSHRDGNEYKLFREDFIYSPNMKDMMFFRYVSEDMAWEEEGDSICGGEND